MTQQIASEHDRAARAECKRQVSRKLPMLAAVAATMLATATVSPAQQAHENWIGTWSASPQPVWGADFPVPTNMPRNLRDQTLRQIAHVSLGGRRVRVVLSNEYGDRPLVIGAAHLALAAEGPAIAQGSDRVLTFDGQQAATIPPGAPMISDPVALDVRPLSNLAVSLYFPETTPLSTMHWEGVQTAYIAAGDHAGDAKPEVAGTMKARAFLSEIMVDAAPDATAIVTFGDLITDGADSTTDANHRWPDFLAERLHQSGKLVSGTERGHFRCKSSQRPYGR